MKNKKKGIILLSGGLDCTTAIAAVNCELDIELALTFDYGQKAFEQEKISSEKIADFYNIKHKIIKLDWLKALISEEIPIITDYDLDDETKLKSASEKVWVPNRNAIFINIAAAFADATNSRYRGIVIGANKEEAENFPDNSKQFVDTINSLLKYSTKSDIKVYAPLIEYSKQDIVKIALAKKVPIEYIYSCYQGKQVHCGKCESCQRLFRALKNLDKQNFQKLNKIYFGVANNDEL